MAVLKGEKWWAGIISQSHLMPLSGGSHILLTPLRTQEETRYSLCLISSSGNYVWSEDPFRFTFKNDTIFLCSRFSSLKTGRQGKTLREVYLFASRTFFPPSGKIPDPLLFTRPQFNTWIEFTYNQNQKDILDYARKVIENGFPPGAFMIDEGWTETYGNWVFSKARFPDPQAMIRELHGYGFKVMLWICPYITPDGPFYKDLYLDHVQKKRTVWILNRDDPGDPAIMRWWDGFSAALDLTRPEGEKWFKGQLDYLMKTYQVDGFKFDGGDANHISPGSFLTPAQSFRDVIPNMHTELFARVGLDYPLNEYRACWKMGGQPIAQRLRDKNHSWEDLRKLIPGIINQGLMGYAFTCPDMIGGGEYLSF